MIAYEQDERVSGNSQDEALLKEIRDRYTYASQRWEEIRKESQTDRKYLAGDPWSDQDKRAREDAKRPCVSHDELNQYVNHAVNNARQNKRGIKIDPIGNGANDKTAELCQDKIRTIEYISNAQSCYLTAYQHAVEGSYGWIRLSRRYVYNGSQITEDNADHQELIVKNIANPDSVLYDPDCKDADWGDAEYCFVIETISREEFKRRFSDAEIRDFSVEDVKHSNGWLTDKTVLIAEYWRVTKKETKSYGKRKVVKRQITQYITNGIEILEQNPEPEDAEIIPIIPIVGKEMYLGGADGPTRVIFSLPRLARDAQLSLAYLTSQQMEEAGISPKVPFIGYKGQFESSREGWETVTKVPRAFLEVDIVIDEAVGQILPKPDRVPFTPNFQQYEIAKDSCRRAIQAAMGIAPLPTAAQRNNEKSGVALERIQQAQDIGSFHFVDNFDRALMLLGRAMLERFQSIYGEPNREITLIKADGSSRLVTLNTDGPYLDAKTNEQVEYPVGQGLHAVTISTGPSYASQREAVAEFVDTLVGSLPKLPLAPPQAAKVLSMAVKMKELGPRGDELAEIISPPDNQQLPPQAMAMISQLQQTNQVLQIELKKLFDEKQAKLLENQYRFQVEALKAGNDKEIERMRMENDLAKAEITAKAQSLEERVAFVEDMWKQLHEQGHERGMQAADHVHEAQLQQMQNDAAMNQAAMAEQNQQSEAGA